MSGGHHHHHEVPASGRRLAVVAGLNLAITAAEVAGGLLSGSLSLLSDALHNFSDAVAVVLAWIALRLAARPRSERFTFGLKRAEVLTAVVNAGVLVAISVFLFVESVRRLRHPEPVAGGLMAGVALVGLIANIAGTLLLRRGAEDNLNLRAAYLHLLSDALSSVAVVAGGLAIRFLGITWIDPLLTIAIALWVLKESLGIVWTSLGMFLLATPPGVSLAAVRRAMEEQDGVDGVHHMHLWQLAEHDLHLEAHVVVEDQELSRAAKLREDLAAMLEERFGINHATLQLEAEPDPCATRELA